MKSKLSGLSVFSILKSYIQYMRFLRRTEGIRSARIVFKKARDDPRSTFHVFVAAAFMEYYCTKDISISFKIFQSGLKQFGHIPEYVIAFVELVKHINGLFLFLRKHVL